MRQAIFVWLMASSVCLAEPVSLRAPAVPLVAHDPYFSIWSPADRLTDCDTTHWTGTAASAARDGAGGRAAVSRHGTAADRRARRCRRPSVTVWPTRTIYQFANEQVKLTLTFLTPALPSDLDVLARPVTYITWEVQSADGKPHAVQLEFSWAARLAVNTADQPVSWDRPAVEGFTRAARRLARPARSWAAKGDDLRIEWGYAYLAAPADQQPRSRRRRMTIRFDLGSVGEPIR